MLWPSTCLSSFISPSHLVPCIPATRWDFLQAVLIFHVSHVPPPETGVLRSLPCKLLFIPLKCLFSWRPLLTFPLGYRVLPQEPCSTSHRSSASWLEVLHPHSPIKLSAPWSRDWPWFWSTWCPRIPSQAWHTVNAQDRSWCSWSSQSSFCVVL